MKKSIAPSYIMHSVLEQRKQWQKQYISVGKTDLFYNSIGLCGNFTKGSYKTRIRFVQKMGRKPIFRTRNVYSSMRYVYNSCRDKHGKKYLKYLRFFLCNFPYSEYKGVIHRGNCTKNKLYNDVEKTLFLVGTLWIPENNKNNIKSRGCCIWTKRWATMCCNEFMCINIPQYERNRQSQWIETNIAYWK